MSESKDNPSALWICHTSFVCAGILFFYESLIHDIKTYLRYQMDVGVYNLLSRTPIYPYTYIAQHGEYYRETETTGFLFTAHT